MVQKGSENPYGCSPCGLHTRMHTLPVTRKLLDHTHTHTHKCFGLVVADSASALVGSVAGPRVEVGEQQQQQV
jgi:hypothetical protein